MFPPLWGDNSYNIGAGMARTYTAAGFVKANMPIAHSIRKSPRARAACPIRTRSTSPSYFTHQPRPDFPDKVNDWPKGGKPQDARY